MRAPADSGELVALATDCLGHLERRRRDDGDVFTVDLGKEAVTIVGDPDAARRVLRSDQYRDKGDGLGFQSSLVPLLGAGFATRPVGDAAWRAQRAIAAEPLTPAGMADVVPRVRSGTRRALDQWDGTVDLVSAVPDLVIDVVTEAVTGIALAPAERRDLVTGFQTVVDRVWRQMRLGLDPDAGEPEWLPGPDATTYRRSIDAIHAVVRGAARRSTRGLGATLAREVDSGTVSQDDAHSVLLTSIVAGYESLSAVLVFALRHLMTRPQLLASLAQERADVHHAVVAETIRLDTPIYWIQRRAREDDVLAGLRVPAGRRVVVITPLLHRHPAHWPNADDFAPGRERPHHRGAWLPFGTGERRCAAERFSYSVAETVLREIARRSTVVPHGPGAARPRATANLRLVGELPVLVRPRPGCGVET